MFFILLFLLFQHQYPIGVSFQALHRAKRMLLFSFCASRIAEHAGYGIHPVCIKCSLVRFQIQCKRMSRIIITEDIVLSCKHGDPLISLAVAFCHQVLRCASILIIYAFHQMFQMPHLHPADIMDCFNLWV